MSRPRNLLAKALEFLQDLIAFRYLGNLKKWKVFAIIRIYSIQKASEKGISLFQWGVALGSKIGLGGVAKDSMRRPVD